MKVLNAAAQLGGDTAGGPARSASWLVVSVPCRRQVELIVTDQAESQMLWFHFVRFGLACPWFPTFDQALDANPFPLPFNGEDWPEGDCLFAT